MWRLTVDDLKKMYENIKCGHITLWYDKKTSESEHAGRMHKRESESTIKEEKRRKWTQNL